MSDLGRLVDEAQRQFTICNACRYCEDYCAAFPAMEERRMFTEADFAYLSTVCHDCRACYQACMYTEPHEFAINIPRLMSEGRIATYERYARPRWLAQVFEKAHLTLAVALACATVVVMVLYLLTTSAESFFVANSGPGSFYAVFPHAAMLALGLLLAGWAILVCGVGVNAYWRDIGGRRGALFDFKLWRQTAIEAGGLRWMRGGGGECHFPEEEKPSPVRRRLHGMIAGGFVLTFAATVAAAVQENLLGILPPYPLISVPVILGTVGGVIATVGCICVLWIGRGAPSNLRTPQAAQVRRSFTWSLLVVSATGLALLGLRESVAMGPLLLVHLAAVFAFFLTVPYGHLVHAVYRTAAIARSVEERRQSVPEGEAIGERNRDELELSVIRSGSGSG
jgi:citrate/tricarballylate utilization protein